MPKTIFTRQKWIFDVMVKAIWTCVSPTGRQTRPQKYNMGYSIYPESPQGEKAAKTLLPNPTATTSSMIFQ